MPFNAHWNPDQIMGIGTFTLSQNLVVRQVNACFNYLQLQIGCDPDQIPLERQIRFDDPTNLHPLLQV